VTAVTITQTQAIEVDGLQIRYADSGTPHLVAPDVGTGAALFLAARHPDVVRSMVVGGGGSAVPLDVTGALADIIIAAPGTEVFESQDIRATIGATVEPARLMPPSSAVAGKESCG
jgi:pimeloyl-ACP methyl ester carboxylesterase